MKASDNASGTSRATKTLNPSSLIIRLPLYIVLFCSVLYIVNGLIGYRAFKSIFEDEYSNITRQFAYTALSYIDGDAVEGYAASGIPDEAWEETDRELNVLTRTAALAYIYVIVPDKDFGSRMYIYDTVHPEVVNGKAYPLGQISSLKNYGEEYINRLKDVMLDGKDDCRLTSTSFIACMNWSPASSSTAKSASRASLKTIDSLTL